MPITPVVTFQFHQSCDSSCIHAHPNLYPQSQYTVLHSCGTLRQTHVPADTHLDALDTYIYFSTCSSHQHLNSIFNPNFDLHTNIATTISDEFSQYLDRIFGHFYDFQSHKIIFAPRHTNTIIGIFPLPITYRSSNISHLGFYWHCHDAHWHVRLDQIYYLCIGHGFYDTVLLPWWCCFIINYSWLISIFSSFISPFLWLISSCIKKDHMHISIKFYFNPYSILLPFTHMDYICFRFIIFSFIPFSLVLFSPFSHPSPIKTHVLSFEK